VPPEYRGKNGIALVIEHPDYTLVKDAKSSSALKEVYTVEARRISVVENFPTAEIGWYQGDARHLVPSGAPLPEKKARSALFYATWYPRAVWSPEYVDSVVFLARRKAEYVGPIRRTWSRVFVDCIPLSTVYIGRNILDPAGMLLVDQLKEQKTGSQ
jgi:hypothetical protein